MIKFLYSNLVDATSHLEASSEQTSLPASNVTHFWKTKVWRATGDTSEWIKFDFGSAQDFKVVCIVGHNFSSGATVKFQANATDSWGSPSVDETLTWNADIILYVWTATQSYRWVRITIADSANADGYVEIGRIFVGTFLEPERNFTIGWDREEVDPSLIEESADGAESVDIKTKYLLFTFPFKNTLTDNVIAVWNAVRRRDPFFIIPDYDNDVMTDGRHDLSRYVKFAERPRFSNTYKKRCDFTLVFREQR